MSQPFSELELTEPLRRAVEEMGFTDATEIQARTIPLLRQGQDVIGRSQTGTGKTLAFGIPAVESVDTEENKRVVQVLILCPTRELSMQACEEIRKLAKYRPGVKTVDIYGGAPMNRQIMGLRSGANIVVGTPGRVMDHMNRRTLKLDQLKMVILDEADEMLSMGFKEDIEFILRDAPAERQTVLFSATMPPEILALTNQFQHDPQLVEVDRKQPSVKSIRQWYYEVPAARKMDALSLVLLAKAPKLAIVFCNTKKMTEELSEHLKRQGFRAEGLNGDMKQAQRTQVMNAFKAQRLQVLVATDVAARGIDVNDVDYVFNYDIPQDIEYYIHRIGRTGRAGKDGNAVTFCSGRRQVQELYQIARFARCDIAPQPVPTMKDVRDQARQQNLEQMEALLAGPAVSDARIMVEALMERGHTPEAIAAAALGLHFSSNLPQIEELPAPKAVSFTAAPSDMGKIKLSLGRANRITPNHVVGAIAEMTKLSGKDIGKIEIYDNSTVVGVPLSAVRHVLERMKSFKICGQTARADEYLERSEPRRGSGGHRREGSPVSREKDRRRAAYANKRGRTSKRED